MLFGVCTPYWSIQYHVHGIGEKISLLILKGNVNMVCQQHKYIVGNVSIG